MALSVLLTSIFSLVSTKMQDFVLLKLPVNRLTPQRRQDIVRLREMPATEKSSSGQW
jgi:hypothetical protein